MTWTPGEIDAALSSATPVRHLNGQVEGTACVECGEGVMILVQGPNGPALTCDNARCSRFIRGTPQVPAGARRIFTETVTTEPFLEPEDRGSAELSPLGNVEYVEDLIRPGRIVVWAAEEGSGKSYSVDDELAIRIAAAGGSFAATWPILRTGPVLYLSEMHPDDDYEREQTVLASLGLERDALTGRYFRLSLMTAAGGRPALTVPHWREWVTEWLRQREALLLIVDTATGATLVDPWGQAIQAVYRDLRVMLDAYPALAIVLVVHVKKPSGRGERRISDVLGEWGRWCDVVVIQENDGGSLERARITVRKRVRHERRIVATKAGGLLVDPKDLTTNGPKVPAADVVAAVAANPGMTMADLAAVLEVSKNTASGYVKAMPDTLYTVKGTAKSGPGARIRIYPIAHRSTSINEGTDQSLSDGAPLIAHRSTPLYRKGVSLSDGELPGSERARLRHRGPTRECLVPKGVSPPAIDGLVTVTGDGLQRAEGVFEAPA